MRCACLSYLQRAVFEREYSVPKFDAGKLLESFAGVVATIEEVTFVMMTLRYRLLFILFITGKCICRLVKPYEPDGV